jgi:hypothetical protein
MNLLILSLILFVGSCSEQPTKNNLSNYKDDLIRGIKKIEKGDSLDGESLIKCIPKTDNEYISFYSLTYPDSRDKIDLKAYYKLIDLFYKQALAGNQEVYKYLLEMSKFVDGEFATSYFEDLDFIVTKDKELFCKAFLLAEKEKTERIKDTFNENCITLPSSATEDSKSKPIK